ncbi:MAG: hypothetical protein JW882_20840 [Deltaproteobacteria bacterium]|nr:hypothetical protein [Deltaproteobacteria bacterium]
MSPEITSIGRKNPTRNPVFIWICTVIVFVFSGGTLAAQEDLNPYSDDRQEEQNELQDGRRNLSSSQESTPAPVSIMSGTAVFEDDKFEETRSRGAQTLRDDVFLNRRNKIGFSLSAYQGYTEDIDRSEINRSSGITSATGQAFINLGRQRSRFHVDFGAGYRRHSNKRNNDNPDYHARMGYSYRISKNTLFRIDDVFSSSYNDSWSFLSMYSPFQQGPDFSNEVILDRQRITRNNLRVALNQRAGRRTNLGIFARYNFYKYDEQSIRNINALEVGGNIDFRLTDWLNLTNSYTTYLNAVDEQYRDTRIHRIQVGGLDFYLGRRWRVSLGGGVEFTDYQGDNRIGESVRAGIGYTSLNAAFSLTYRRGYTSAIGISRLMQTDNANVNFGYRITRWMYTRLESFYYRSTDQSYSGLLNTLSGGGGLEFALADSLQMILNAYYQRQQTSDFSIEGLDIERITAYLGFQYIWPARRYNRY